MSKWNKSTLAIVAICLTNIVIHLVFLDNLEYHRDELLYFSTGLHPHFGYASIPPLTAWLASILQSVFGYTIFAVKVFPAFLSGLFTFVTISITRELGGNNYAQILSGIALIIMPLSLRAFHLFQPVCIDIFFWTLIIFYSIRYVNTNLDKYLVYIGIASGFALLNKYLVALLLISLLCSIAFSKHKNIFTKKHFYIGLAACLIICSPNLIWQITNGLPVINHMSELNAEQLVNVSRITFVVDQFTITLASAFLAIIGLFNLAKSKRFRYLATCSLLTFSILIILRGKSYYTMGIIPLLIAAGAVTIEKYVLHKSIRMLLPLAMIAISIPFLPFGIPTYNQAGMIGYFQNLEDRFGLVLGRRFEDGSIHTLPQDYADQIGWEELTAITAKAYEQIPDKNKSMIYCENYGQAGAISIIGKKYGLPEAVSFEDSFMYWIPTKLEIEVESFIYINDELGQDINDLFQDIKIIGQISNPDAREYGTTVYLCTKPKYKFSQFWNSVLEGISSR